MVFLNSNPLRAGLGKNTAAELRCGEARKYNDRGDLCGLIVKFGKGLSKALTTTSTKEHEGIADLPKRFETFFS